MLFFKKRLDDQLIDDLKEYVRDIIGILFDVHNKVPCGYHEYLFQEALDYMLTKNNVPHIKEYEHHPIFDGMVMKSCLKMDFMIQRPKGNIIIECKAIKELTNWERNQLYSYLIGTEFPVGILVNFGTYPKVQLEKYYFDKKDRTISSF